MSEEEKEIVNETKQLLENLTGLDISERFNNKYTGFNFLINSRNVDILIKVIEKQQNRIDELEKALIDENLKYRDKIKQYEEQNKEYLNAIKSILLNIPNNEIEISNKDIVQAEKYYVVAKRNVMNNSQKLCLYKGGV